MGAVHTTANTIGIERDVIFDAKTGQSLRYSKSAGGYVDLGKHSSLSSAREAAEKDIRRGVRDKGDFSER